MPVPVQNVDAELWNANEVKKFLKQTGLGNLETSANGLDGCKLLALVDQLLSVLQSTFNVSSKDARDLRQKIRELRAQTKGRSDAIGREIQDEADFASRSESMMGARSAIAETRTSRMNIVAVGKTGQGKSATLNTILHYNGVPESLFDEVSGMRSGTRAVQQKRLNINGISIRLVDTIGLFDTEEEPGIVAKELARVVQMCSDGIHAFLIVLQMTERLTKESRQSIDIIRQHFGTHMLNYAFFILTGADLLTDTAQRTEQADAVREYTGIAIEKNRLLFFDNHNRQPAQVDRLLDQISANIKTHHGPYTNAAFEIAQQELQKAIEAEQRKAEQEKQQMIDEATVKVKSACEVESHELHEKYKNDAAGLQAALEKQKAEAAAAISEFEQNAELKYGEQITELLRQHEEDLQLNIAKQTEALMQQQTEIMDQFAKQIKDVKELHEQRMKDHALQMSKAQESQKLYFEELMKKAEETHQEQLRVLHEQAKADAKSRDEREQRLKSSFAAQLAQCQQQATAASAEQREQFLQMQREMEERQAEALQLMQQNQASQLSALQAQLASLNGKQCAIM